MSSQHRFVSASTYALDTLADIFTRSFEGYFYPGTTTAAILAARARIESIDLLRSVVLLVGDEPAGVALLSLRADQAWCGGFGITSAFRGRGLAHLLAAELIEQARQAGAARFSLEVLTRNQPAIHTYTRAGLQMLRDLQIFEWRAEAGAPAAEPEPGLREAPSHELLAHFARLHPAPAAWQRDLPALLVRGPLRGLALGSGADLAAYALYQVGPDGGARIEDLGARTADAAAALLRGLQRGHSRVLSVNEPARSPLAEAYLATGFREADRQHEMALALG